MRRTEEEKRRLRMNFILQEIVGAKEKLEMLMEEETEALEALRDRAAAPEKISACEELCDAMAKSVKKLAGAISPWAEAMRRGW